MRVSLLMNTSLSDMDVVGSGTGLPYDDLADDAPLVKHCCAVRNRYR